MARFTLHRSSFFQMSSDEVVGSTSHWEHLTCCFHPDWHQDDEDEMMILNAIAWLNEAGADYVVSYVTTETLRINPIFPSPVFIEFYLDIDDLIMATKFRLIFPQVDYVGIQTASSAVGETVAALA